MRQVLQNLRSGRTSVMDVPAPGSRRGFVLVRSEVSLISTGTERMLVGFGRANPFQKARQQPEKVRQVLQKMRTDGLSATVESVSAKLDEPMPLGYCNVGRVTGVGAGVSSLRLGDVVVSNGPHADVVSVPASLCAPVPAAVSVERAVFCVPASIALQGIRLAEPTLGETVAVVGLGLVGLLAVELLLANGCRVLGVDPNGARREIAAGMGCLTKSPEDDIVRWARSLTGGHGVDAVVIAAATDSSSPVRSAAEMCRKRGRIIMVGATGMSLDRKPMYEKELKFQVSCSYGPGRYDPEYEVQGHDYPIGYVRWTEHRNFLAVLDLMARDTIRPERLLTAEYELGDAEEAYARLLSEDCLALMLRYDEEKMPELSRTVRTNAKAARQACTVGVIGAGAYAGKVLIPGLKTAGASVRTVVSLGGVSAAAHAARASAEFASTDIDCVMEDPEIDAVVIATRHDTHAELVSRALSARKHVYVEKPLGVTVEELEAVTRAYEHATTSFDPVLMVGFNRRFAPLIGDVGRLLKGRSGPLAMIMTVNAGELPVEHWSRDAAQGGRIVGEACHFIDLFQAIAGAPILDIETMHTDDDSTTSISLRMKDGSIGSIHYFCNGSRAFPKERLEVFCDGRVLQLDNFRRLRGWGWGRTVGRRSLRQDKGNSQCIEAFVEAVRLGRPGPIPIEELLATSALAIKAGGAGKVK